MIFLSNALGKDIIVDHDGVDERKALLVAKGDIGYEFFLESFITVMHERNKQPYKFGDRKMSKIRKLFNFVKLTFW
jgi:hypothetical protein